MSEVQEAVVVEETEEMNAQMVQTAQAGENATDLSVPVDGEPDGDKLQINIDNQTAFTLKLQEFDKTIAEAEAQVADLKKQKVTYVYESNVQSLVAQHKEKMLREEAEAEVAKKLAKEPA